MTLFVDTSVWSLALRRDTLAGVPEVQVLQAALSGADLVVTTGIVVQELLQGFSRPKAGAGIVERFAALPLLSPDRQDHVEAAALRNLCRRKGLLLGTIDALLAQLCIHHDLTMLTTDRDFEMAARHCPIRLWHSAG